MSEAGPSPDEATDRPALPWRIVAGAFLHFALPAYLFIGLACCAAALLDRRTPTEIAARILPYSTRFAVLYLALAVIATAIAVMLDPLLRRRRRRRVGRDPDAAQRRSRRNLAIATAEGRSRLDPGTAFLIDGIAARDWHHDDPAFQSVSADLAELVRTSITALGTATPDRRPELSAVTTETLTRLAARLHDLQERRGRLDEGDLRTVSRYIDSRYPRADCTGDSIDRGVNG